MWFRIGRTSLYCVACCSGCFVQGCREGVGGRHGQLKTVGAAKPKEMLTCGGVRHDACHLSMEHANFGTQAGKQQLAVGAVHIVPLLPAFHHCWPCHPAQAPNKVMSCSRHCTIHQNQNQTRTKNHQNQIVAGLLSKTGLAAQARHDSAYIPSVENTFA